MSEAAITLDMTKTTVSKAVSRLESIYQVRLMERNSRNIRLTPEGQTLYEYAERVLQLADEAGHALTGMQQTPQGTIQIAVPLAFIREILAPNLVRIHQLYPKIQLHIQTSHHAMDVLREDIDMAVEESAELKLVHPSRHYRSTRVRAVIEFIEEICRDL